MFSKIENLRNSILESFQDIDYDGYLNNKISKTKIDKALSLVRCFISESMGNKTLYVEAHRYMSILERYVLEHMTFDRAKLYEGFYNPFDDEDNEPVKIEPSVDVDDKNIKISKIKLWDKETTDKIYFDKGRIRAGKFFGKGDTIEIAPVRLVKGDDLYSRNIRDMAFTIDSEKGIYAIPFGYASYYRNSKESGVEPNADYELIPSDTPTIRIYATSNIRKGNEIILISDDIDFENEIRPDQFNYEPDKTEPYLSIKNFKIV